MTLRVFSVYDTKAMCFGVPFFMGTIGAAVRAFGDLSGDAQSTVAKHPSDYILYQIGEFDDSKGGLVCVAPPRNLGCASDFIDPVKCDKVKRDDPKKDSCAEGK